MVKRRLGYYWIKLHDTWIISEWNGTYWYETGNEWGYNDEEVEEIGSLISLLLCVGDKPEPSEQLEHDALLGVVNVYEIDFDGDCKARIKIENNEPTITDAMNGGGHIIDLHKIKIVKS